MRNKTILTILILIGISLVIYYVQAAVLGYESIGETGPLGLDNVYGLKVVMPENGIPSKMTAYMDGNSIFGANTAQGKIYDDSFNEVANGETEITPVSNDVGWVDLLFSTSTPPELVSGTYNIAIWGNSGSASWPNIMADTGGAIGFKALLSSLGVGRLEWPANLSTDETESTFLYSLNMTYDASGDPASTTPARTSISGGGISLSGGRLIIQ